jgi:broad specificity phosphatase PhoE
MNITLKNDFYIVRHGKAKNNMLGIESCKMETQIQYGLIPEGKKTVEQEAKRYSNFDLIFYSPFRRTQETAAYFVKTSKCDFFSDKRLVDIDLGDFDQSTYESSNEHLKNHPETDYVFPNGESFLQVLERLKKFILEVNTKYDCKKILIVSHGFPCETLLDWVANKPLINWDSCIEKGKVFPLKP